MIVQSTWIKWLFGSILIGYLFLGVFGLMILHEHEGRTGNCPYMVGQHTVCSMDALGHIEGWRAVTNSIPSPLEVAISLGIVLYTIGFWYLSTASSSFVSHRSKEVLVLLYQQLFSKGTLNPKAP